MSLPEPLPGIPAPVERPDTVAAIRAAIAAAPTRADLLAQGDVGHGAHLLDAVRAIRRDLSIYEREDVEPAVAELMDERRVEVDGLTLERRRSTDRRLWQSGDLLRRIVRSVVRDEEGDLRSWDHPDDLAEALVSEIEAVMPVTGSLGWRVGALRDRGIDPEEWCEAKPGRTTVTIASGATK